MPKPKVSVKPTAHWLLQEIEEARVMQGLTQEELCSRAEVPLRSYRNYCQDQYSTPWLERLDTLLEVLGKRLTVVDLD